jgi:hypothetical protein
MRRSTPPPTAEALWLIGLFTASIGLPFFALAANSPLLQAWFARTDHPDAKDPYFLYAASNVGSFLALLSYPLGIEPFVRLGNQAWFWSIGFCLLIVLLAACGILLWRSPATAAPAHSAADAPPTWKNAAFWVALAAVPAGLLVAVTAHISTDVAAAPLLWVLPLALYLLTFVIAFSRRPIIPHRLVVALQPPFVVALVAVIIFNLINNILWLLALHLAVFFVNALMCHGELARTRPPPRYLTAFYLWISAGGVIGGIATGLIAPHVFNSLAEAPDGAYDLIIVDAFSSDAVPIHLLTREAMAIYLKKLSPHGMVVLHVSNRHLELASVVAGIGAANGLITRVSESSDLEAANPYKFVGTVAAVARSEEDFGTLAQARHWATPLGCNCHGEMPTSADKYLVRPELP